MKMTTNNATKHSCNCSPSKSSSCIKYVREFFSNLEPQSTNTSCSHYSNTQTGNGHILYSSSYRTRNDNDSQCCLYYSDWQVTKVHSSQNKAIHQNDRIHGSSKTKHKVLLKPSRCLEINCAESNDKLTSKERTRKSCKGQENSADL